MSPAPEAPSALGRQRPTVALALAALSLVWGTQYLVIRLVQAELPPWRAVALRFAVVAILGQGAAWFTRARAAPGTIGLRLAMGLTQALSMGLLYAGQLRAPSALASVVMAMTPIFVVGLAHRWLGERASPRTLFAAGLGLGGIALMSGVDWADPPVVLGVALVLGAAVASAASKTIGKAIADLPVAVLLRDLGAVVTVAALAASLGLEHDTPWTLRAVDLAGALYLGAVASTGANAVYLVLLRRIDVSRISYLQIVSASIGLVAGVVIAGERLDARTLACVALVLAGAVVHASAPQAPRALRVVSRLEPERAPRSV